MNSNKGFSDSIFSVIDGYGYLRQKSEYPEHTHLSDLSPPNRHDAVIESRMSTHHHQITLYINAVPVD